MTYSIGTTGARADALPFQPENLVIEDAAARPGSMANYMQTGAQFLAKGPDGAQRLYTYDAERSTPDIPILKLVG